MSSAAASPGRAMPRAEPGRRGRASIRTSGVTTRMPSRSDRNQDSQMPLPWPSSAKAGRAATVAPALAAATAAAQNRTTSAGRSKAQGPTPIRRPIAAPASMPVVFAIASHRLASGEAPNHSVAAKAAHPHQAISRAEARGRSSSAASRIASDGHSAASPLVSCVAARPTIAAPR